MIIRDLTGTLTATEHKKDKFLLIFIVIEHNFPKKQENELTVFLKKLGNDAKL